MNNRLNASFPGLNGMEHINKWAIKTEANINGIITVTYEQGLGELKDVSHMVVNTKEQAVRRALIALGWTPPPRVRLFGLLRAKLIAWLEEK